MIHGAATSVIEGDLELREIRPADVSWLHRLRTAPQTRERFLDCRDVPYAEHEAFVARYFSAANCDQWFAVRHRGEAVGTVALYGFSPDGFEAEWGRFVVDPRWRGQGIGRRALRLLLAHAVNLGLHRVHCWCLVDNEPAIRLYRSLGFSETGRRQGTSRQSVELGLDLRKES